MNVKESISRDKIMNTIFFVIFLIIFSNLRINVAKDHAGDLIPEEEKAIKLYVTKKTENLIAEADVLIEQPIIIWPIFESDYLADFAYYIYFVEKNAIQITPIFKPEQLIKSYSPLYISKNSTPFDSGQYSFVIKGINNIKKNFNIKIGIKSKPIMNFIHLSPLDENDLKKNWTATVEIYSYPEGEITWYFTPCKYLNIHKLPICNEKYKYKIEKYSNTFNSSVYFLNTTVVFQPKESGIITCNCINDIDDIKISSNMLLEGDVEAKDNITLIGTDIGFILQNTESDFLNINIDEKTDSIFFNISARNFVTLNPVLKPDYKKYLLDKYKNVNLAYYWKKDEKIITDIIYTKALRLLWPPFYPKTEIFDSCNYTFVLQDNENNFEQLINVTIAVTSKPLLKFIEFEPLKLYELNKLWAATVETYLYPAGEIIWYFTPCDNLYLNRFHHCDEMDKYKIDPTVLNFNSSLYFTNTTIIFEPEKSGILTCTGINELAHITISKYILLDDGVDKSDRMTIKISPDDGIAYVKGTISLKCDCISFYNDQQWYSEKRKSIIQDFQDPDFEVLITKTEFQKSITLKINDIKLLHEDVYECRCYKDLRNLIYDKVSIKLDVKEKEKSFWATDLIYITIGMLLLLITLLVSYIFYQKKIKEKPWTLLYDKRYEFPVDRIKIESELGSGAFGVVFEAIAEGILPNEPETVVAVKTIKKSSANESTLRALESELEILLRLGKHINIINLLGTVTKSNQRYRLMVIVEFCKYGNLKSFIFENKISFNNEMDFTNGIISNVYDDNIFSTNTLIYWSYQIAKGMEYVSLLNILHGDLAARNILLCDFNIVKICDFGLAKSINYHYNYQTKDDTPLPIRWLAIETLECGILSSYSDIWSYGIMIWELFSLCNDPYRRFPLDRYVFLEKLTNGYRLEKPKFANNEIYQTMMECWKEQPKERPTFSYLVKRFENILAANALEAYTNVAKLFEEQIQLNNSDHIDRKIAVPNEYHLSSSHGMELIPSTEHEIETKKIDKNYYTQNQNSNLCNENIRIYDNDDQEND